MSEGGVAGVNKTILFSSSSNYQGSYQWRSEERAWPGMFVLFITNTNDLATPLVVTFIM